MIRSVYRALIQLHPRYFRDRFEEEMLREKPTLRLVGDAFFSLLRQWTVRPQFWEESPTPATSGAPQFYMLRDSRPATGALVQGGILSVILFTLIGLGLSHGTMPEIQSGFSGLRNLGHPFIAGLAYAVSTPARWSKANSLPPIPMPVPDQVLQTYAGTFITEPPDSLRIFLRFEGGCLRIAVEGEPSFKLVPSSETRFVVASGPTRSVEFTRDGAGHILLVTIVRDGKVLHAHPAVHR
jgi:hypothetical protein